MVKIDNEEFMVYRDKASKIEGILNSVLNQLL